MRLVAIAPILAIAACSAFGGDPSPVAPVDAPDGGDAASDAASTEPGPAADLAIAQQTPTSIVLDATFVYWINEASGGKPGSVVKVSKGGGDPIVVAADIPGPYELVADATRLYFTANDDGPQYSFLNVWRQDKVGDGGAERKQINANGTIFGCALQNGDLFWVARDLGTNASIGYVDTTGPTWDATPAVPVGSTFPPLTALAADATSVYAAAVGKIIKIAKADGTSVDFAATQGVAKTIRVDVAASVVYWTDAAAVRSLDATTPGAAPTDVATDPAGPSAIALDATRVYWTNVAGAVRWIDKTSGAAQTISTTEVEPLGIAVDDSGVYWTNHGDGRVRVARLSP